LTKSKCSDCVPLSAGFGGILPPGSQSIAGRDAPGNPQAGTPAPLFRSSAQGGLLLQQHFDGIGQRVNRFEIKSGFDRNFLAGQILGHSP
jgi:hypothetical protein